MATRRGGHIRGNETDDGPILLDRLGVARLLCIRPRSVREYIKRGVLVPLRARGGRKLLFRRADVLMILEPAASSGNNDASD